MALLFITAAASAQQLHFLNRVCVYFPGGKAFGLLKAQQREKLEEVNRVKR